MSRPGQSAMSRTSRAPQGDIDQLLLEIRESLHKNLPPVTLADAEFRMPDDISHIQNVHNLIVQDLEELKRTMERYICIVDKTELIMSILNYKQYELTYAFRTEFDKLKEHREALTEKSVDLDEQSKVALQIVEIDDQIEYMTEDHQRALDSLKEQKIDAQKEYENAISIMDDQFEKMRAGFKKLLMVVEAEKRSVSEPQAEQIEQQNAPQVHAYQAQIGKYAELQTSGWKVMFPEEKISATLQERGLKVSMAGLIMTEEGKALTLEEANDEKLFDGLGSALIDTIRQSIGPSASAQSNKDPKGGDAPSSKSGSSASSKMSSEDVGYLKTCLGKALTLALAEITAVQPRDPVHYLGHWLFKFRYNQQMEDVNNMEFEALNELRIKLAQERWHKFIEEEARACVIDMIIAAEETAMMNELKRIQKEAEAMEEQENLDDEARDVLGTYNGPTSGQVPL